MVSFAPGAAAAAAGHQNNPPPMPTGKYFTHPVGTGVSQACFNEVVVQIDFKDDTDLLVYTGKAPEAIMMAGASNPLPLLDLNTVTNYFERNQQQRCTINNLNPSNAQEG